MESKRKYSILQKGFVSLSLIGLGVLIFSAVALPLISKYVGTRRVTRQRAETCSSDRVDCDSGQYTLDPSCGGNCLGNKSCVCYRYNSSGNEIYKCCDTRNVCPSTGGYTCVSGEGGCPAGKAYDSGYRCSDSDKICCAPLPPAPTATPTNVPPPTCGARGGTCRNACLSSEKSLSEATCESSLYCCVPKTPCLSPNTCVSGEGCAQILNDYICSGSQVCCARVFAPTATPTPTTSLNCSCQYSRRFSSGYNSPETCGTSCYNSPSLGTAYFIYRWNSNEEKCYGYEYFCGTGWIPPAGNCNCLKSSSIERDFRTREECLGVNEVFSGCTKDIGGVSGVIYRWTSDNKCIRDDYNCAVSPTPTSTPTPTATPTPTRVSPSPTPDPHCTCNYAREFVSTDYTTKESCSSVCLQNTPLPYYYYIYRWSQTEGKCYGYHYFCDNRGVPPVGNCNCSISQILDRTSNFSNREACLGVNEVYSSCRNTVADTTGAIYRWTADGKCLRDNYNCASVLPTATATPTRAPIACVSPDFCTNQSQCTACGGTLSEDYGYCSVATDQCCTGCPVNPTATPTPTPPTCDEKCLNLHNRDTDYIGACHEENWNPGSQWYLGHTICGHLVPPGGPTTDANRCFQRQFQTPKEIIARSEVNNCSADKVCHCFTCREVSASACAPTPTPTPAVRMLLIIDWPLQRTPPSVYNASPGEFSGWAALNDGIGTPALAVRIKIDDRVIVERQSLDQRRIDLDPNFSNRVATRGWKYLADLTGFPNGLYVLKVQAYGESGLVGEEVTRNFRTELPSSVSPTATPTLEACTCPAGRPPKIWGNANCDYVIDRVDLNLWINRHPSADFNCNGEIDRDDLAKWIANFGRSYPTPTGS